MNLLTDNPTTLSEALNLLLYLAIAYVVIDLLFSDWKSKGLKWRITSNYI